MSYVLAKLRIKPIPLHDTRSFYTFLFCNIQFTQYHGDAVEDLHLQTGHLWASNATPKSHGYVHLIGGHVFPVVVGGACAVVDRGVTVVDEIGGRVVED